MSADTVVAVLAAMDVDASSPDAVRTALADRREQPWRRALPPYVVTREGETPWVRVHVPHGEPVSLHVDLEDGGRRGELPQLDVWVEPRTIADAQVGEATFGLPGDLPLGWHLLRASWPAGEATCPLVVTPRYLGLPGAARRTRGRPDLGADDPALPAAVAPVVGASATSRTSPSWPRGAGASWAPGSSWSTRCTPPSPVPPVEPSPYLPVTRRFVSPLYLRVEDVPETGYLTGAARAEVERAAPLASVRATRRRPPDRPRRGVGGQADGAGHVHAVRRTPGRQAAYDAFLRREGEGLQRLRDVVRAGRGARTRVADLARGAARPGLARPSPSPRAELADRVDFYCWLQWCLDEQLGAAAQAGRRQPACRSACVHDLAVGVHPDGADAWALQDVLARGVTVGAPPDAFNQHGPGLVAAAVAARTAWPRRATRRTATCSAPCCATPAACGSTTSLGLFRLWWVPGRACRPSEGTYVRYDHEALVGILALEAQRAGARRRRRGPRHGRAVGARLPRASAASSARRSCGSSGTDAGDRCRRSSWRELCLATVTTHDLPPTAGYLAGEHVRIRDDLGLLTRPVEEERRESTRPTGLRWMQLRAPRAARAEARRAGRPIVALHRFLPRTPAGCSASR